jgi:hypothetical protein
MSLSPISGEPTQWVVLVLRIENGYMVERNKVGLSTLQAIYTV